MTMSKEARELRNRRRRERYANDPEFRKKEIARAEAYWERQVEKEAEKKKEG